uniref:Major facilitator superfamily (MFS) profile domain-containing protein n=1 Tax=Chrysemys picta bellii TaxID=8478 RepID=A0A8C3IBZ1_CHRPI
TAQRTPPPDGGWGWLVALAVFLESGLIFGVIRSFGVFFVEFVGHFGELVGRMSWVTSITVAILLFASLVGTALSTQYCARPVVMAGSLLSGLGMFLASFATSLTHLYLSIGLLSGRSCPEPLPCPSALWEYPHSRLGAKMSSLLGLALLSSRPFLSFAVAGLLMNLGHLVPFAHLVSHAREMGFDEYQAACLMSVMGATDLCGHLVAGWLDARRVFRLLHSLTLWTLLTGVMLLLVPFGHTYPILMGIDICYGFLAGAVIPLKFSSLVEIVGTGWILEATGLVNLLESFGALAGPPLSSFLRDVTGSYTGSFIASGTFLMVGGLVLFTVPTFPPVPLLLLPVR